MHRARVARTGFTALAASLAIAAATIGCATGAPGGARNSQFEPSYQPFSGPAPRRDPPPSVPSEDPQTPRDTVTAARADRPDGRGRRDSTEVDPSLAQDARERVVTVARRLVGKRRILIDGRRYRNDCTGLVVGALQHVGVDVFAEAQPGKNAVTQIFRYAQSRGRIFEGGRPLPGDLVFFRETYDLNRDGRANDGLTHVGIVEDVEPDDTVIVIHRVKRGVVRYRMNLSKRDLRVDAESGRVLNDYLRHEGPRRRDRLTGQLFAAYATLFPESSSGYSTQASSTTTGGR